MIYVMSGSRRETLRWATAQGIPYRHARHVYDAQTLPGRIAGVRFVQLEGFETLRNRHAIVARLKRANYRDIEVELWRETEDGEWYQVSGEPAPAEPETEVDIPIDGPSDDSVEEPQDDTPTAEPEPEQEAPAAETDEVDPLEQFIGLTEAPADEESEEEPMKAHEVIDVVQPVEAEQVEDAKPKRTRRTKVQMAYDAALADWESNGGSLEAVIEARDALAAKQPDDERLLTAPQSDEEVEAQAEDDDALDF